MRKCCSTELYFELLLQQIAADFATFAAYGAEAVAVAENFEN